MPKMTNTAIKLVKLTKLRIALSNIQQDLKIIEDNDIIDGDMVENFKNSDGELITENLLQLVKADQRRLMNE